MNNDTVNLIERPYQEIVDDILTAIVGGVVNEPLIHDLKEDRYPLSQPASNVRGVTGTLNKAHYTFQKAVDFQFSGDDNAIIWQSGGVRPDDETTFYVDYFRKNSSSPLSDINVGSVTRTLGEAIGREIATIYQQIKQAYLAAFIDTATGKSLDLVVAIILGIPRMTKEFATGLVTFFRNTAAGDGNITIPQGVTLSTEKGDVIFVTTDSRTLQRGQVQIDVPIRASESSKGDVGKVGSGAITKQSQPILGIARVTNFEATMLGAADETDEQLRARAKAALRSLGKATLAALRQVIFEGHAKLVEVWDPNSPPVKQAPPGAVTLLVEAEPARFVSLDAAVQETRAAGVQATLIARYVFFKPRVAAKIASGLPAAGKLKVKDEIIKALQTYVDGLSAGDPAKGVDLVKAVKSVKEVNNPDTRFVDVISWRSDIGQPGAEALIDALLDAVAAGPSDQSALRSAFSHVLTEKSPTVPSGRRIADRSLVQGASGRATDQEIEAGQFQVLAKIGDENGWVVLDIERADIDLRE